MIQVRCSCSAQLGAVTEISEPQIASPTEQLTNHASLVVMIHGKTITRWFRPMADSTHAILGGKEGLVLVQRQPKLLSKVAGSIGAGIRSQPVAGVAWKTPHATGNTGSLAASTTQPLAKSYVVSCSIPLLARHLSRLACQ